MLNTTNFAEIVFKHSLQEWATTADNPFSQLLQEDCFTQVQLDSEGETLVWANGVNFCRDTLYLWGSEAEVALNSL